MIIYSLEAPLCVLSIIFIKLSHNKKSTILWGVLSLIFVSLIGGILILTIKENDYINTKDLNNEELKELQIIRKDTKEELIKLFSSFNSLHYLKTDKKSAKLELNTLLIRVNSINSKDESNSVIDEYKEYLSRFNIDEEYDEKKRKLLIKLANFIAIGLVSVIAVSFLSVFVSIEISKNNKYNNALKMIDEGKYDEAIISFESLKDYKSSEDKINLCYGLRAFSNTLYNKNNNNKKDLH